MSAVCETTVAITKTTNHSSGLARRECPVPVVVVVAADVVAAGVVVDSNDEGAIVAASADPM